jgi:ABC-type spermidine/putrescine transport system permease subunit I
VKVESAAVATLAVCVFLAFYFAYLSFQSSDEAFRKQLVFFAASTVITAVVVVACLVIYLGFRQVFCDSEFRRQKVG